ncbi:hypothetical protein T11_14437 [Trichinella zimbabwensis]|uniref:Uncharacterized protein n=1 Tax=Trichinella zimbabwensis TaxID=268475 RepID=A0A0V1HMQ3_9BILA|nr:hypothetical protein T11_14437 [Trichinella zimbabwensis]
MINKDGENLSLLYSHDTGGQIKQIKTFVTQQLLQVLRSLTNEEFHEIRIKQTTGRVEGLNAIGNYRDNSIQKLHKMQSPCIKYSRYYLQQYGIGKNCVEKETEKEDNEEEEEEEETPLAHWRNADLTRKSTQIED